MPAGSRPGEPGNAENRELKRVGGKIIFMKKLFVLLFISTFLLSTLKSQVTVEAFPMNPQTGSHNYFGVRVTLSQQYPVDIIVAGYIYDVGEYNTNHPYSLTVTSGNLSAETVANFYETGPASIAEADINSMTSDPAFSLLNLSVGLLDFITTQLNELNSEGEDICTEVNSLTTDVSSSSGELTIPNWVRFVQISREIDLLNNQWGELYADKMEEIINYAYSMNAVNGSNNEATRELVWDILEENFFVVSEYKATACLEAQFNFSSLRSSILAEEDSWLDQQTSEEFNPGDSPMFTEELYDEEFWSLINSTRAYTITDTDVEVSMFEGMSTEEQVDFIETIQEIVDILGDIVNIASALQELFADCAGTTTTSMEDYKHGVKVPNEQSWIGYYIIQKGQAIDFTNKTITKIKGKARLYKEKNNGKRKRDRKNVASIGFCAKEWNNCDDQDWPSNTGPYVSPHTDGQRGGRVKVKHHEPKALAIEYTYHFLQFKFGKNGIYAGARNLLGNTGCTHASNTNW